MIRELFSQIKTLKPMSWFRFSGAFALAAVLFAQSTPAFAQLLDDRANMKILSMRSRVLLLNRDYFDDILKEKNIPTQGEDTGQYLGRVGCGSVEIGNQTVNSTMASEISVIIVGDVINFGNRCGR